MDHLPIYPPHCPATLPTTVDVPLEVKADSDGRFEGYASVYGVVDRDGDRIVRGAFDASIKQHMPALLWQHSPKDPIGRLDVVREDTKGLFVRGRLAMEGRGAEAYALLKMGALDGLSIGFVTKEASRDAATGVRTITRADLAEISLVTFPANSLARIEAVKAAHALPVTDTGAGIDAAIRSAPPADVRAFEHFLRDQGGFSRAQAKAIIAKGWTKDTPLSLEVGDLVAKLDPTRF